MKEDIVVIFITVHQIQGSKATPGRKLLNVDLARAYQEGANVAYIDV